MTLRGLPLVLQATLGDGVAFDPLSLQQSLSALQKLARLALHQVRTASARQAISAVNFQQFHALTPNRGGARLHPPRTRDWLRADSAHIEA